MQNYSPFIHDREIQDDGFSKGWGFHFPPSEEYVVDIHAHTYHHGDAESFRALLDSWFLMTEAYRQQKIVLLVNDEDQIETMPRLQAIDPRVQWMLYAHASDPCPSLIRRTRELGACGLKLHNNEIMKGNDPLDVWRQDKWQEVFAWCEQEDFPILWHVTQRVSYSPYHGGGYNSYFKEGQAKGIRVTNEQLLQELLALLRKYPGLKVIGAHQMYLGLDRLSELFEEYPNLYIDSSVGFFLRWCDELAENDRRLYHDFFVRYADRILFGTDTDIMEGAIIPYQKEGFCSHLRFIHRLDLPYDVLQKVTWQNAERLLHIPPSDSARKYNTRP